MPSTTRRSVKDGKGKPRSNRRKKFSYSKKFVRVVRQIAQGTQETKQAQQNSGGNAVFHNGGIAHVGKPARWFENLMATNIGPTDQQGTIKNRIGDAVSPVGVKLLLQFRQPVDRPNVTFKVWIVKYISKLPPAGMDLMAQTGNLMLDSCDTEKMNPVLIKSFKTSNDYWTGDPGSSKEVCFHRKMWISLPRSQYTYDGDDSAYGKRYNLAMYVGAYDTSGTLVTDIVGYCHATSIFYFKDA